VKYGERPTRERIKVYNAAMVKWRGLRTS